MRTKNKIAPLQLPLLMLVFLFIAPGASSQVPANQKADGPIFAQHGISDTIICSAVVYEGDTIEAKILAGVYVWGKRDPRAREEWTRLRNAIYVTYPYAKRAGWVFTDIENHIAHNPNKQQVSKYINSREKELKKEFTEPLKNLSVYQGKVLMKLINRETGGTDCYSILKEFKGGFTARFWQTVAFVFGSDLKQPYDAKGKDAEMESIVKEVQRMYGYSG
jgi:hypothetical protein